jgi:hypothetical protein
MEELAAMTGDAGILPNVKSLITKDIPRCCYYVHFRRERKMTFDSKTINLLETVFPNIRTSCCQSPALIKRAQLEENGLRRRIICFVKSFKSMVLKVGRRLQVFWVQIELMYSVFIVGIKS